MSDLKADTTQELHFAAQFGLKAPGTDGERSVGVRMGHDKIGTTMAPL